MSREIIGRAEETSVEKIMSFIDSRQDEMKIKKERRRALKPKSIFQRMWGRLVGGGGGGGGRSAVGGSMVLPPDGRGKGA